MNKKGKQHSLSWLRIEGMFLQTMNCIDLLLANKGECQSKLEEYFDDYSAMVKQIKPIYEKAKDLWDNEPYDFQRKSKISYDYQKEMEDIINKWVDKWIEDRRRI